MNWTAILLVVTHLLTLFIGLFIGARYLSITPRKLAP